MHWYSRILFALYTGIALMTSGQAGAKELPFHTGRLLAGRYLEVLFDTSGKMTPEEVVRDGVFRPVDQQVPNYNFQKATIWARLTVRNASGLTPLMLEIENPLLSQAWLYEYSPAGIRLMAKAGIAYPFDQRMYRTTDFIYDLQLPANATKTYLLKLESKEQIILPIFVTGKEDLVESLQQRGIIYGMHIGILLVMILYNFFIYLSVRDRSYLFYVLYILFIGLTQTTLTGYTYRYLFPHSPQILDKAIILFPALAGVSALFFIRNFLHTEKHLPRSHRLLWIWIVAYSASAVMRIAGFEELSSRMVDITALTALVMVYYISIHLSLKGNRSAMFFVVAWTIFILGLLLYVLRNLGILPYNLLTNYTMHAGTALEVTLLSIALADRINIFRKEKEVSQAQALEAARENERIIRDQNIVLEARVAERTEELSVANKELNRTLEELKGAQSQLVESEKMASLGQLTAGIAHEINNPINFVIANVRPLRRDIDLLKETLAQIETLAVAPGAQDEVRRKIAAIKEEVEYDYLTDEIEFLLKGISEGSERTAEIVKGLRIFARVDEDDLKKANIHEGLDSTTVIVNTLLNNKITIGKHYAELPYIECYPGKLNQVFLNIITNSIHALTKKFGDKAGGRIDITTSRDERFVTVRIRDNGMGIPAGVMSKIFDPFFTTKDVGEGTGLGLSIAYNIIKKHNGNISVESEIGEGTEFIIELPILQH